jgi:multiple sugar transport system substrate-binding protein
MKSRQKALIAVGAGAALALTACSGGGVAGPSPAESGPPAGKLSFASWQWEAPVRGDMIWDAVRGYEDANPGATLEQQSSTRAGYEKTISTQIGAGGGADLIMIPDTYFSALAEAGALEPLDGVLTDDETEAMGGASDGYVYDDEQLAVSWGNVPFALAYNKKLLDEAGVEPPKTFDEFLDAIKTVTEVTGKTGFGMRHLPNEEASWWVAFCNLPYGFGGSWSEDGKLTIDSPENIKGTQAMKDLYDSGAFGVGDDGSTIRSKFAAGEIAFILDNASAVQATIDSSTVFKPADFGSTTVPFPSGVAATVEVAVGINANSPNKELAKDFIRWLYTEDAQQSLVTAQFPSAIGTPVMPSQDIIDANPWVDAFYEQAPKVKSVVIEGFEAQTPEISHIILVQLERVLAGTVSAKEAMKAAQQEAEALG